MGNFCSQTAPTLRQQTSFSSFFEDASYENGGWLFPMYLVKIKDFLNMTGIPEPHQQLKQKGLLHTWQPGMFSIFVSHQWLGRDHPDPAGEHTALLREVLRKVLGGSLQVQEDIVSNFYDCNTSLSDQVRKELHEGYLFYDWFAIPQITLRQRGVNEDVTRCDIARAVNSIPAYVERANLFVGLVPFVQHQDCHQWCGYSTWLARGWCRAELWLHMLSSDEEASVVMINSSEEVKFMFPHDWLQNSVSEGKFTVEADKDVVVSLCEQALEKRIRELELSGPLRTYRFYRSHEPCMLRKKCSHAGVQAFLDTFKFSSLREAALDQSSMNGLTCAVFAGDVDMLRLLAGSSGDVNLRLHGLGLLGYFDGQSLLMAAVKSSREAHVLATLIELRAEVNARSSTGMNVAGMVKSPDQLRVLEDAMADLHTSQEPFGFTPLTGACGVSGSCTETIKALLLARCDPNPPLLGAGVGPLHQSIIYSRGQHSPLSTVRVLLEAMADPNAPAVPSADLAKACEVALKNEVSHGRGGYGSRSYAIVPGLTPLHAAAWVGDPDIVQLLLDFRADVRATNRRNDSPDDLAAESGNVHLLPMLTICL
eukprot:Skav231185  [mRNA]  locus=scaffold425:109947:112581:+ [translate_table: standard]